MKRIAAEPDSYLLTGTNRKCMEPRNIQRKFQKLLQQCEIPSINIHSLRHAFATRCTEMGFDSKTLLKFWDIRPSRSPWIFMCTAA